MTCTLQYLIQDDVCIFATLCEIQVSLTKISQWDNMQLVLEKRIVKFACKPKMRE